MAAPKYHDRPLYFIFLMMTVYILYTVEGVLVDVRLANGTMPNEGTVWYTEDCQNWYRTCGSGLGIQDVIVICRHLGFAGANRALMNSPFGGPFDNQPQTIIDCGEKEGDITTCTLTSGCPSGGSTGGAVCYGINYLGCYKDMKDDRVLNDQKNLSIGGLTIDKCLEFCRSFQDMVFAGLENGNECYCGESSSNYSKHGRVSDSGCHYQCDGTEYQSCGGGGVIAIFNLTADSHLPPSPMDSPCSMTTPPISTTSSTVTENTVQTTTSQETSMLSVSVSTETITSSDGGRPTTSIGSGLTVMLTEPRLTSASSSPPVGTTTSYAAIGGGVTAAVVVCIIIVIILVYRCKCKPKENNKHGVGLEEMACEKSPPTEYETTIMAFPDASGSDTLRMEMKDDQQGEIEKEAFTPQMVEYENTKGRDNPGFMEPVHIYESMAADARGKTAVTLKEA